MQPSRGSAQAERREEEKARESDRSRGGDDGRTGRRVSASGAARRRRRAHSCARATGAPQRIVDGRADRPSCVVDEVNQGRRCELGRPGVNTPRTAPSNRPRPSPGPAGRCRRLSALPSIGGRDDGRRATTRHRQVVVASKGVVERFFLAAVPTTAARNRRNRPPPLSQIPNL
uniref:Uncharacterized protein n=1 Tax=Plectus sambesii TaxID=2011161 RepID=A0A914WS57_9BILA